MIVIRLIYCWIQLLVLWMCQFCPLSLFFFTVISSWRMAVSYDTLHHKLPRILQFLARQSSLEVKRGDKELFEEVKCAAQWAAWVMQLEPRNSLRVLLTL